MYQFSVDADYRIFNTSSIIHIHRYLKKKHDIMFRLIKKMFIELLNSTASTSNHEKCVYFWNQEYIIQPTLINLHPNECSQELHYCPFEVNLARCTASCKTLNDLCNKVCVQNRTEDLNLSMFIMITAINKLKTLTKQI